MKEVAGFLPNDLYQLIGFVLFLAGALYGFIQGVSVISKAHVEVQAEKNRQYRIQLEQSLKLADEFYAARKDIDSLERNVANLLQNEKLQAKDNKEILELINKLEDGLNAFQQNFTEFLIRK